MSPGSRNLDHHNSWQSARYQVRVSNCRSVALQALLYFAPMWPRRSEPKRLGSEHCGVALTPPSPGRAFTAVPHPRLGRCLSTLVRLAGPSSPLCHSLEEFMQGTLRRVAAADCGQAGSNPRQVRLAVVSVPAGFTKAQSFGLLPRGQAAFLAVEPQATQAVLVHGSGELKGAVA